MALLGTLSEAESSVIQWMRKLSQTSQEWKLIVTKHERQSGSYLQLEPSPYLKISVTKDSFLAIE